MMNLAGNRPCSPRNCLGSDPSLLCEEVKPETSYGGTSEVSGDCVKKEETLEVKICRVGDETDTTSEDLAIKKEDPDNNDYLCLRVFNKGETVPVNAHFAPYQGERVDREEAMNSGHSLVDAAAEMDETNEIRPRKRRNVTEWKRNIIKEKKVKGEEHVNWRGNLVPARKQGPDCGCKRQCSMKISDDDKLMILEDFNSMTSKDVQDTYLFDLISMKTPKRRRVRNDGEASNQRSTTFFYKIRLQGDEHIMCKKAFANIHGISFERLRRIGKHCQAGTTPKDLRGCHGKQPKADKAYLKQIHEHVRSYPYRVAYYGKSGKKTRYLPSDLTVHTMWMKYLDNHEPEAYLSQKQKVPAQKPIVKYEFFLRYYRDHFNYPFGRPRVDVCSICERLELKIKAETDQEEKAKLQTELKLHKTKADQFYSGMTSCEKKVLGEEKGKSEMVTFSFMQNIPFPHIPVSEMLYFRQLWLYIFGIHRFSDGRAFLYTYDEITAEKGPIEVVSMLHHFIQYHVRKDVKTLYLFSDSCTSQYRNNTMVPFLYSLVHSGRFDTIKHMFPTRGHSYTAADRDFSQIELMKRKQDVVYTAQDWMNIIEKVKANSEVIRCTQEMFKDYTNHLTPHFKSTSKSVDGREKWKVNQYKVFIYKKGSKAITVSSTSSGTVTSEFDLLKPKAKIHLSALKQAYSEPVSVKPAKLADIRKVIDIIPEEKRGFFDRYLQQQGGDTTGENEASGSELWDSD